MKALYLLTLALGIIFASEPPIDFVARTTGHNCEEEVKKSAEKLLPILQNLSIGQQALSDIEQHAADDERAANQKLLEQKILDGYLNSVGFQFVNGKIQKK